METESPKEDRKKQEDEDKKRFAAWASRSPIFNGGHSEEDRAQEALNRRRSSAPNAGFVSIYFKWNAQNQAATTAISSTMSSSTMSAVSPSATSITSSSLLPQTNTHTLYTYTPSTDPVAKVAPVELPKLAVPHASISAPFFPTTSTMSELFGPVSPPSSTSSTSLSLSSSGSAISSASSSSSSSSSPSPSSTSAQLTTSMSAVQLGSSTSPTLTRLTSSPLDSGRTRVGLHQEQRTQQSPSGTPGVTSPSGGSPGYLNNISEELLQFRKNKYMADPVGKPKEGRAKSLHDISKPNTTKRSWFHFGK